MRYVHRKLVMFKQESFQIMFNNVNRATDFSHCQVGIVPDAVIEQRHLKTISRW